MWTVLLAHYCHWHTFRTIWQHVFCDVGYTDNKQELTNTATISYFTSSSWQVLFLSAIWVLNSYELHAPMSYMLKGYALYALCAPRLWAICSKVVSYMLTGYELYAQRLWAVCLRVMSYMLKGYELHAQRSWDTDSKLGAMCSKVMSYRLKGCTRWP